MSLLAVNRDAKTSKGIDVGVLTGILYLAPADTSGTNVCAMATAGCKAACLFTAGRGGMDTVRAARIAKTHAMLAYPDAFRGDLIRDIDRLANRAYRDGLLPAVRLNGTSDLDWSRVIQACGNVQFYDYTKVPTRMRRYLDGKLPKNYHLTFSRSECNDADALDILRRGGNVAVVFSTKKGETLPATWNGFRVIDGDENDARFLDPPSVVVGLRAKGKAKKDTSGFVVQV